MRRIHHSGSPAPERVAAVAGSGIPLRFVLQPGRTVDEAVAEGMRAAGCIGGFVTFQGGRCEPFRYVMPAASSDPRYAAWYSETYEPAGPVDVTRACAIVGIRDGKTFLHCHGLWDTADGPRAGHMLAPLTVRSRTDRGHRHRLHRCHLRGDAGCGDEFYPLRAGSDRSRRPWNRAVPDVAREGAPQRGYRSCRRGDLSKAGFGCCQCLRHRQPERRALCRWPQGRTRMRRRS